MGGGGGGLGRLRRVPENPLITSWGGWGETFPGCSLWVRLGHRRGGHIVKLRCLR